MIGFGKRGSYLIGAPGEITAVVTRAAIGVIVLAQVPSWNELLGVALVAYSPFGSGNFPSSMSRAGEALRALRDFNAFLENDLIRRTRDWRLGADLFVRVAFSVVHQEHGATPLRQIVHRFHHSLPQKRVRS